MTFEETTNHLNRHPSITFAFDCCYRLSRGKKKTLLDDERENKKQKKKTRERERERNDVNEENGHSRI